MIVVNQTFARRTFPGEDAIGKRIVTTAQQIGPLGRNLPGMVPFRIVGVVADIHQAPIGRRGEPVIYHTQRQFPFRAMTHRRPRTGHRRGRHWPAGRRCGRWMRRSPSAPCGRWTNGSSRPPPARGC